MNNYYKDNQHKHFTIDTSLSYKENIQAIIDNDKQLKKEKIITTIEPLFGRKINTYIYQNIDTLTGISINAYGEIIISNNTGIIVSEELTLSQKDYKLFTTHIDNILNEINKYQNEKINIKKPFTSQMIAFFIGDEKKIRLQKTRIAITRPPVSPADQINIRLPPKNFTLDDYYKNKEISHAQLNLIKDYIKKNKNILIIGTTHSGKTTLLNACLHEILQNGDLITLMEDTQEIYIEHSLLNKRLIDDNIFHPNTILKHVLREDVQRICVGEVRDELMFSVLHAWDSGHKGGICTIHCDSINNVFDKIRKLCTMSNKYNPNIKLDDTILMRQIEMIIEITAEQRNKKRNYRIGVYNDKKNKLEIISNNT